MKNKTAGIPIILYAHLNKGKVTFHIESSFIKINEDVLPKDIKVLDTYEEMSGKRIIDWVKNTLNVMKMELKG